MVWCVQAIWDLSLMGKTSWGVLEGSLAVALGSVVLGPGAVLSLVWWWKEGKIVGVDEKKKAL